MQLRYINGSDKRGRSVRRGYVLGGSKELDANIDRVYIETVHWEIESRCTYMYIIWQTYSELFSYVASDCACHY